MPANIEPFNDLMPRAVKAFWQSRIAAAKSQMRRGTSDQGNRASVTAGKNLDAFAEMVKAIIVANGIPDADVLNHGKSRLTLPGFYRPTKVWDLLVVQNDTLLAAIEFKSQVGPSFGNNFNNRVEEAIGNATDLMTAYREGAFGQASPPFLGYFFVLEDHPESNRPRKFTSPHFEAFDEFNTTSYAHRYDLLCQKLVREQLYTACALVLTSQLTGRKGGYRSLSDLSSADRFAARLAGHISGLAARP